MHFLQSLPHQAGCPTYFNELSLPARKHVFSLRFQNNFRYHVLFKETSSVSVPVTGSAESHSAK